MDVFNILPTLNYSLFVLFFKCGEFCRLLTLISALSFNKFKKQLEIFKSKYILRFLSVPLLLLESQQEKFCRKKKPKTLPSFPPFFHFLSGFQSWLWTRSVAMADWSFIINVGLPLVCGLLQLGRICGWTNPHRNSWAHIKCHGDLTRKAFFFLRSCEFYLLICACFSSLWFSGPLSSSDKSTSVWIFTSIISR